jgi:hypothetical protein
MRTRPFQGPNTFFLFFPKHRKDYCAAMKPIFIFCALVCAASARADLVLQQQITVATNNSVATIRVKGAKVRLDLYAGQPRAISTITDLKTGDAVTLLHQQKMFVQTTGAPAKQTGPADNGAITNFASNLPRPRATGQTQKVGNWDFGTAWVAKNFPDYARIQTDLAVLDKAAAASDRMDPELSTLPGMVVRSQVTGDGRTIIVALISAKEESLDASLFQIPANYKELPEPKSFTRPAPKIAPGK